MSVRVSDGDSFEELMRSTEERTLEMRKKPDQKPSLIQTAEKNASLFDFIKMVNKMVTVTMKQLKVEFISDEGRRLATDPSQPLDHPVITYKVITRKNQDELKPRFRQEITEKTADNSEARKGDVWGQKQTCMVQFNIYASVYELAEQVMEEFEKQIFTYTGYFKRNGVSELLFLEQLTDTNYDLYRQTISVRNLRYRVDIEKLIVMFQEKIQDIDTLGI